jgi:hypothetical protein
VYLLREVTGESRLRRAGSEPVFWLDLPRGISRRDYPHCRCRDDEIFLYYMLHRVQ